MKKLISLVLLCSCSVYVPDNYNNTFRFEKIEGVTVYVYRYGNQHPHLVVLGDKKQRYYISSDTILHLKY